MSAPSGCGKTTLCKALLSSSLKLVRSVSVTTRSPREGEEEGQDYFFVSKEVFEKRRGQGEFLEWAEVHGNFYGTPARFIHEAIERSSDVLLSIDVQGAMQVKQRYPRACFIFILPPSIQVLEKRLRGRLTEDKEAIALRMEMAKLEFSCLNKYHYAVVNDKIESAVEKLKAIVIAERSRV